MANHSCRAESNESQKATGTKKGLMNAATHLVL